MLRLSKRRKNCIGNEHFALYDANCEITCDNYNKPIPRPRIFVRGCVCNIGLVRGPDKKCIKPTECPTKPRAEAQHNWCEEYEVWDFRYAHCPRNCSNYDDVLRCRKIYVSGCVCDYANGYVRGSNGKCVTIEKCPNKTDIYTSEEYLNIPEIYTNNYETLNPPTYTHDDHHIPESVTKISSILEIEDSQFEEIPPISHSKPSHKCPPRHRWVVCGGHCQRNCSNKDDKHFGCRPVCIPGCICEEGLVKGPDGKCIEKDKCPKTLEVEEDSYVTLNPPPYTDDDYHIPESVTKISLISETEDSQFEEIPPISHSKPSHKCPPRHRWVVCGGHCQRNCSNKDDKHFGCRPVCIPGCICEEGLVKGPDGKCIEKDKCPKTLEVEEDSYVTLNPPPYTDDDYHIPESVTKISLISETEDSQFEEIPPISHSKPSHICPPRHRWVVCGGHCQRNCSNKDDKQFGCRPVCIPGCICEEGLVKGPDGKCIEKDKCPKTLEVEGDSYVTLNPPPYTDDDYHIPESVTKISSISETEDSQFEEIPPISHSNVSDQFPFPIPLICSKDENRERCPSTCPDNCKNYKDTNRKCGKIYVASTEHPSPAKSMEQKLITVSENNRLIVSENAGCLNDNECSISCREYGHRYGHCTGRNSLVCSCYIENYENVENDELSATGNPCPNENACRILCRRFTRVNVGRCTGPNHMTCDCF
ncbi:unnamed protein product [Larinioides sclopetarius]|uniref:TIL domain-containing protein n=1 Tax=Larinioides sclopetarius TaxID=280406 RepID=A0AAV2BP88_9ARAC